MQGASSSPQTTSAGVARPANSASKSCSEGRRPSLQEFEAEFAGLATPTLIVCGEEDAPCIETSRWLARTLPAARLWEPEGLGHAPNLEDPRRFNREVGAFLDALT